MTAPHACATRSGLTLRNPRGSAAFAAVCVVLAGAGHALASCDGIPLWTLGAGFLGVAVGGGTSGRGGCARCRGSRHCSRPVRRCCTRCSDSVSTVRPPPRRRCRRAGATPRWSSRPHWLVCGTTAAAISPAQAHKILTDARIQPPTGAHTHLPGGRRGVGRRCGRPCRCCSVTSSRRSPPAGCGATATWQCRGSPNCRRRVSRKGRSCVPCGPRSPAAVRALRAGLPGAPEARPHPVRAVRPAPATPRTTALQHTVIRRGPPAGDGSRIRTPPLAA
ncbi:Integral membrane protein OS=Streptomyces violarus OX=67380 GN=FHS41_004237 PE=4 SV=1 [Streptomyces violarus]